MSVQKESYMLDSNYEEKTKIFNKITKIKNEINEYIEYSEQDELIDLKNLAYYDFIIKNIREIVLIKKYRKNECEKKQHDILKLIKLVGKIIKKIV